MMEVEIDEELLRRQENWSIYHYVPLAPTKKKPHWNDQLGFHRCMALVRIIIGGNRSGKTDAMMAEVAALVLGEYFPWWFSWDQAKTPKPPFTIWIVIPQFPAEPAEDARMKKLFFGDWVTDRETGEERWREPFIPRECILSQSPDYRSTTLTNGCTIIFKSGKQDDLAYTSDTVHLIVVDEPTSTRKWSQLLSRAISSKKCRIIHGLTDITDTTDYLDALLEKKKNVARFEFTTHGNPHNDESHAEDVQELQTEDDRLITKFGKRRRDLQRMYPYAASEWPPDEEGNVPTNRYGTQSNWINPIPIPADWTWYAIHDPGTTNPTCTYWFAVEEEGDIHVTDGLYVKHPPVAIEEVVVPVFKQNKGRRVRVWWMDPKGGKFPQRTIRWKPTERRLIDFYNEASTDYGVRWALGADHLEKMSKINRSVALGGYLSPHAKKTPMIYFHDTGEDGMEMLKFEFKNYRKAVSLNQKRNNPEEAINKHNHAIYCCEAAAILRLKWRPPEEGVFQVPTFDSLDPRGTLNKWYKSGRPEGWEDPEKMM